MNYNLGCSKNNPLITAVSSYLSENSIYQDFPARISQWPDVSGFFSAWANKCGCPDSCALPMEMALEELFTNTASYGYPDQEGRILILLSASPSRERFQVTLADNGIPFNPLDSPDPPLGLPVEQMPVGGLGIHMVKKLMDYTEYQRYLGCNVFTFVKYAPLQGKGELYEK